MTQKTTLPCQVFRCSKKDEMYIYLRDGLLEYEGDEAPAGPTDTFLLPNAPRR